MHLQLQQSLFWEPLVLKLWLLLPSFQPLLQSMPLFTGGANVSYFLAKEGHLPVFFDRKVWDRGTEGLLITSGLVILLANFLPLDGVGMLASASLLIIYIAVNISHLQLLNKTGAKSWIIKASLLSSLSFFVVLVYYEFVNSKLILELLIITILFCFSAEWIYRRSSGRSIKERTD